MFVKHNSVTEFGKGNFVSFPIRIESNIQDIPVLKDYQDQLVEAFACNFNPSKVHPKILLTVRMTEEGIIEPTETVIEYNAAKAGAVQKQEQAEHTKGVVDQIIEESKTGTTDASENTE